MSRHVWIGYSGLRLRGPNLAAAVVGLAAAGLIVAGGLTGGLGFSPRRRSSRRRTGASRRSSLPLGGRCMRGNVGNVMGRTWTGWKHHPFVGWTS